MALRRNIFTASDVVMPIWLKMWSASSFISGSILMCSMAVLAAIVFPPLFNVVCIVSQTVANV